MDYSAEQRGGLSLETVRIRSWGAIGLDVLLRAVPILLLSLALVATRDSTLAQIIIALLTVAIVAWVMRPSLRMELLLDDDGVHIAGRTPATSVELGWEEVERVTVCTPVGSETIPVLQFHARDKAWDAWPAVELGQRKREQLTRALRAFADHYDIPCSVKPEDLVG
jgi:hypothetical protein